jgi:hypothetical protein
MTVPSAWRRVEFIGDASERSWLRGRVTGLVLHHAELLSRVWLTSSPPAAKGRGCTNIGAETGRLPTDQSA